MCVKIVSALTCSITACDMNKTTIEIKDLAFYAYHGVLEEEAKLGQRFKLDLKMRLLDGLSFKADSTESTVNYAEVIDVVSECFVGARYHLIERAAEVIAATLLERFEKLAEVSVRVKKPSAPVDCICEYVAVEVTQCR